MLQHDIARQRAEQRDPSADEHRHAGDNEPLNEAGVKKPLDGDPAIDVGLQQVFKFSHDGKLLLALGEPRVGAWDVTHFNQPTDIAIRPDGTFYVSDGYVNSRVAVFDRNGKELAHLHSRQHRRAGRRSGELATPVVRQRRHVQTSMGRREGRGDAGRVFAVAADAARNYYVGIRRADYDSQHTGVVKLDRDWRIVASVGFGQPETIVAVESGVCLTIPLGTHFQFRSLGAGALSAVGVTMPPWPGEGEAVVVQGKWKATVR